MKAMSRPVCAGCGYRYDPKKNIRVFDFICDDGHYIACESCIEKVGELKEQGREQDIEDLIRTFRSEIKTSE